MTDTACPCGREKLDRCTCRPHGPAVLAQQIAAIYNGFAERQGRLGAEFEAAIFSDIESLYEAI